MCSSFSEVPNETMAHLLFVTSSGRNKTDISFAHNRIICSICINPTRRLEFQARSSHVEFTFSAISSLLPSSPVKQSGKRPQCDGCRPQEACCTSYCEVSHIHTRHQWLTLKSHANFVGNEMFVFSLKLDELTDYFQFQNEDRGHQGLLWPETYQTTCQEQRCDSG